MPNVDIRNIDRRIDRCGEEQAGSTSFNYRSVSRLFWMKVPEAIGAF